AQMTPEPSAMKIRPLVGSTSSPAGRPPMTVPLAVAGVGIGVGDGIGVGCGMVAGWAGAAGLDGAGLDCVTTAGGGGGTSSIAGAAVGCGRAGSDTWTLG